MTPLEVRDLKKDFGAVAALRGVTFSVAAGEVFGYLGPNGAGKTTTLRVLLGLVRATSGSASILGDQPGNPASRANVGFVPGDLRLYNGMTGAATLDFFARFRPDRPPVLRTRLMEALALDQATLGRRIKFLSHGTRQKIGLVAALQHDPQVLLLDEPTNGLDPLVQRAFREVIRDFAARGAAVLFSSHVLSEVEDVCRRVAILRQGRIVALESIDTLRRTVIRRLRVRFTNDVPSAVLNADGVTRYEVDGRTASLWVRGDLNALMRVLAQSEIEDLVFPEPELEDIFLGYYADA